MSILNNFLKTVRKYKKRFSKKYIYVDLTENDKKDIVPVLKKIYDKNLYDHVLIRLHGDFSYAFSPSRNLLDYNVDISILNTIDFSRVNLDLTKATNCNGMFMDSLNDKFPKKFDCRNFTQLSGVFWNCVNMVEAPELIPSKFHLVSAADLFINCKKLKKIKNLEFPYVETMANMFEGCENLESVHFNAYAERIHPSNLAYMFFNCKKLTKIYNFKSIVDTSYSNSFNGMFNGCKSLSLNEVKKLNLDISSAYKDGKANLTGMFANSNKELLRVFGKNGEKLNFKLGTYVSPKYFINH